MSEIRKRVSSGIPGLDRLLNGLYIGDNVIWYDDAGSLAAAFCMKFIDESRKQKKPVIYVSFDRSPKNLVETLGPLAQDRQLTVLDCFTNGKGDQSEVFDRFFEKDVSRPPCQVVKVADPWKPEAVAEAIYGLHKTLSGDVRLVIESLTGMQDLWGGEEPVLKFYSRSCPKLYELDTIAYWIIEKGAHSTRLKSHINQIAQVAVDLSVKRGKSEIKVLKAEKRTPSTLNEGIGYVFDGQDMVLEGDRPGREKREIGSRIRAVRRQQGMSQKDLAALIGMTPSSISQIESSLIYPSLPALYKIAETLSVAVGSFFQDGGPPARTVFPQGAGVKVVLPDMPRDSVEAIRITPPDLGGKAELYLVRILAGKKLPAHFFAHKGEEAGYVTAGAVVMVNRNGAHALMAGDAVYLQADFPEQWVNNGADDAELLWIKIR